MRVPPAAAVWEAQFAFYWLRSMRQGSLMLLLVASTALDRMAPVALEFVEHTTGSGQVLGVPLVPVRYRRTCRGVKPEDHYQEIFPDTKPDLCCFLQRISQQTHKFDCGLFPYRSPIAQIQEFDTGIICSTSLGAFLIALETWNCLKCALRSGRRSGIVHLFQLDFPGLQATQTWIIPFPFPSNSSTLCRRKPYRLLDKHNWQNIHSSERRLRHGKR